MDDHKRSVAKTLTWRALATLTTIIIVYAFTRKWVLSLGIGAVELVAKMIVYYLHERAWERTGWGKKSESS